LAALGVIAVVEDMKRAVLSVDDLRGRSGRREFWTFLAVQVVSLVVIVALYQLAWAFFWAYVAWFLLTVPAVIALAFRRLHDSDRSAWWLTVALVPGVGLLVLLVLLALPTDRTWNRFGPPPGLLPTSPRPT
jgi:uncharacterized membrane protein YhaH (DUF805 family)